MNLGEIHVQVDLPFRYHWIPVKSGAPRELIILLHGYAERAERILRLLGPALPEDAAVLAPNGIFPMPIPKDDAFKEGYAWYFYDAKTREMVIPPDPAIKAIRETIVHFKAEALPVRIVGFSQGGYLAPILGQRLPQTRHAIGISGGFPARYYPTDPQFRLDGVHGTLDRICDYQAAKADHQILVKKGWPGEFVSLPDTEHRITETVVQEVARLLKLPLPARL